MAFCSNCGKELAANDKFCSECGAPVQGVTASQRKTVYDGELHKCPNCGEVLDSFSSVCPTCGYEIRGVINSAVTREFATKLEKASSHEEKVAVIRNFPIPNTKEDILEFLIIASSNISDNLGNDISKAWQSKVEQAYQKAQLVFKDADEFAYVQNIYSQVMAKFAKAQAIKNVKKAGASISKLMPSIPSIIIVSVWIISIFVLIPLCSNNLDNVGSNGYQLILIFDFIAGAALIPFTLQCKSSLPKVIVVAGLILSILVLICLSSNSRSMAATAYEMMLLFDGVCSIVILVRMFKKK